jgi:hypothetical protein
MKRWATWLLAAAVSGSAFAADLKPTDFAYGLLVETGADDAAYRVPLPVAVYQTAVRPDLGDLRVFNSQGELVPYALERPDAGSSARQAVPLPLFHLKDTSAAALDAVRITVESGKSAVNVQTPGGSSGSAASISYLLDARAMNAPVAAFIVQWPDDAADFAGRMQVEAGDTLGQWQRIASAAPVANLHAQGEHLVERRLEITPTQAKFWRLSWVGAEAPFGLTGVLAEPARATLEAARANLMVPGKAVSGQAREYEFDLGARPPIDRVNLELPELNTTIAVDLLSRTDPKAPWRSVVHAGLYRLKSSGTELRNGPIHIAPDSDRYWLARIDARGGGLGNGVPRLSVGWVAQNVVFLARGSGPYLIAYGSATVAPADMSLDSLPKAVQIGNATAAAPSLLGGRERLRPATSVPWRNGLLWAVLVVAAGILAAMVLRLSKEMGRR